MDELQKLGSIRDNKTEGAYTRSRALSYQRGNNPSTYIYSLEIGNYVSKIILKLDNPTGTITSTGEILNEQRRVYQSLYSFKSVSTKSLNDLINTDIQKINKDTASNLEGKICRKEFAKNMQNNKSPVLDGFTIKFFKFFSIDLGDFVLKTISEGYDKEQLSLSLRRGVIPVFQKLIRTDIF